MIENYIQNVTKLSVKGPFKNYVTPPIQKKIVSHGGSKWSKKHHVISEWPQRCLIKSVIFPLMINISNHQLNHETVAVPLMVNKLTLIITSRRGRAKITGKLLILCNFDIHHSMRTTLLYKIFFAEFKKRYWF